MDNLIIVAHPDDEIIWMGGKILENKKNKWTIISLCRAYDLDRKPKFLKVCRHLKADCIISDLEDENLKPIPPKEISEKIKSLIPKREYDKIYTHGNNGEYGHIRHKEIHKAVKYLVKNKKLICRKLLSFSYTLSNFTHPHLPDLKIPRPKKRSDEYIRLSKENYKKKVSLVRDMYGFGRESFEVLSCHNTEAFNYVL